MKTLLFCLLLSAGSLSAHNFTQPLLNEDQKIERLISYISTMNNAVFIRNGSEYSPSKATDYLQYKLKRDKDQIFNARDFIRVAGTKSNSSGKPLLIKFADGSTRPLSEMLTAELLKIEKR